MFKSAGQDRQPTRLFLGKNFKKDMSKKSIRMCFLLLVSLIFSLSGLAQTQIVKGTILDAQAHYPLIGATE